MASKDERTSATCTSSHSSKPHLYRHKPDPDHVLGSQILWYEFERNLLKANERFLILHLHSGSDWSRIQKLKPKVDKR